MVLWSLRQDVNKHTFDTKVCSHEDVDSGQQQRQRKDDDDEEEEGELQEQDALDLYQSSQDLPFEELT